MTEIRIRHEDEAYGVHLGDVPLFDTEKVISHLNRWGVRFADSTEFDGLSGEFVVDETGAYFEVMAGRDD